MSIRQHDGFFVRNNQLMRFNTRHNLRVMVNRSVAAAIVVCFGTAGFSQSNNKGVDSSERITTIGSLLDSARKEYSVFIHVDPDVPDTTQKIIVSAAVPFDTTFALMLKKERLDAIRIGGTLWIKKARLQQPPLLLNTSLRDTLSVSITVTNSQGEKLAGVTISSRTSGQTLKTDEEGNALYRTWRRPDTLLFSYIDMEKEKRIVRKGGSLNLQLHTQFIPLNEAVVSEYATTTKLTNAGDRIVIDEKQQNRISDIDVQDALSGIAPGVQVDPAGSFPGAVRFLTIQGNSSIANGRDPLYIIDHVPYPSQSVSNIPSGNAAHALSPFSLISVGDIQRIEILKDADATAIYGSRGANGVILITTNQGTNSKRPLFSLEMAEGWSNVTRRLHLMNRDQYTQIRMTALHNDGLPFNSTTAPDLTLWNSYPSADWSKWLTGSQSHQSRVRASLTGGNDTTSWFLGMSWLSEDNIFPLHPIHRLLTGNGSLQHRSANRRLDTRVSVLFGRDRNNQFINDPTYWQFMAPVGLPFMNQQGEPVFKFNGITVSNPWSALLQPYSALSYCYLADASIGYQVLPALTIRTNLGYNKLQTQEYSNIPISAQDGSLNPTGTSYFAHTFVSNWIIEPQLEYKHDSGKLKYSMLLGATSQLQSSAMGTLTATGYTNDSFLPQPGLAPSLTPDSLSASYSYKALFARITGNWMDRYILNLTGRRDGSSRFGPGKQFGNFWAASFAWVFSNEKFARNTYPVLSFGKLRTSYGITGNDQVGAYGQAGNWAPTGNPGFQSLPGYYSPGMIRSGQTWESIHKWEIALELGWLKNRIFFTGTWYRHRSSNQLLPESFPLAGKNTIFRNWPAVLENRGWEFTVLSRNINSKRFQWMTSFNASLPVNRLLSFSGLAQSPFSKVLLIGQSITVQQALRYEGVSSAVGTFQFEDRNGDGHLTAADKYTVGNLDVHFFAGFENTFHLDRCQLQFTIAGEWKSGSNFQGTVYSANPPGSILSGFVSNETPDLLDSWHQPGDHAAYQQLTTRYTTPAGRQLSNYTSSNAMLVNASVVRLKNLQFSYQLPPGFLKKMPLSQSRVFLEGQNLFTISPYKGPDPATQSILIAPPLKTILIGIHVEF